MTATTTETTTRIPLPPGAVGADEWEVRQGDLVTRYVGWVARGELGTTIQNGGEQAYSGEVIEMHPALSAAGCRETVDLPGDIPALLELHANLWATIEELAAIRGYDLSDARAKIQP